MIKIENLVVGKRYYIDITKTISGVFKGKFNEDMSSEYIIFTDIIKDEAYDGYYITLSNGDLEFAYREDHEFLECEITYEQLELTF
jgi:hypothetical protein